MLTPDLFRSAMGALPMAVCVVTASVEGRPVGATIGSVTSTSMRPPLVSFNVRRTSRLRAALQAAPRFAVHVLAAGQAELSARFAAPEDAPGARFAGVPFEWAPEGTPRLEGAALRLACRRAGVYPAGDHVIVLGAVEAADAAGGRAPLVYAGRAYHGLEWPPAPLRPPTGGTARA